MFCYHNNRYAIYVAVINNRYYISIFIQIFVHSDVSTLHEHVPKDMLPAEYGGNGCSLVEVNGKYVFNFLYVNKKNI